MTSQTLTITCPPWCQESPAQHIADGAMYHKRTVGGASFLVEALDENGAQLAEVVEVQVERYDSATPAAGDRPERPTIRVDNVEMTYEAAKHLAFLLLKAVQIIAEESE